MTECDILRRQTTKTWAWFEETVADVSAAQANWWPPGTANSIGATYLHVVINTDVEINRLVLAREPVVEAHFAGNVGQAYPYDAERFDRWVRHAPVDWDVLREYGRMVHNAFVDSLADLTPELLDMPVDMTRSSLGMWQGRDLYELHATRTRTSTAAKSQSSKASKVASVGTNPKASRRSMSTTRRHAEGSARSVLASMKLSKGWAGVGKSREVVVGNAMGQWSRSRGLAFWC